MPGRLLAASTKSASREAGKTMGMYKLTIPGSMASQESRQLGAKGSSGTFRNGLSGNRYQYVGEYVRNVGQQQPTYYSAGRHSSVESTVEMEPQFGEDDELVRRRIDHSTTSRARVSVSGEDSTSTVPMPSNVGMMKQFGSRGGTGVLTNVAISDDDLLLREVARRTREEYASLSTSHPTRHSTATCSDLAFRRELRKRLVHAEPSTTVTDESAIRRDSTSSLAVGSSFRRELEKEDRVESLALWEEENTDHQHHSTPLSSMRSTIAANKALPHSWHAGDMARNSSSRRHHHNNNNNVLDTILRKKKPSFFNGLFFGLSFSSSRKSRKPLG